ncbi:ArsR family transcriptional regulator [Tersicoccus phoenicis]|uniref:ArsR family transcriptional regulator n=1 Tax=Tersicoccus phoenicis TaxID=554083 RepID=A0A1R1L776_9MICC|nr:winged helix-turn-helix domain-containing protein [Tersicoccus phoenicis]OMH23386.1 ArsR family transcriptional regulator [Tersicoccus phoenicis]
MDADDEARTRGRALSSPLRIRILRYCLHEARTNKEIAERFDLNPATSLHHVRTLADAGFLAAEPERRGTRGAREVPYLATRLSWRTPMPPGTTLVDAFLADLEGVAPDQLETVRLGIKLNEAHRRELLDRIEDVLQEYAAMPADDDGEPTSIFFAHHPDLTARNR